MTQYAYEYGRRWDARIPRADIRWLVGHRHAASAADEIAADVRKRCNNPFFTPRLIEQSVAYALECHRRNRELYRRVMRGC